MGLPPGTPLPWTHHGFPLGFGKQGAHHPKNSGEGGGTKMEGQKKFAGEKDPQ